MTYQVVFRHAQPLHEDKLVLGGEEKPVQVVAVFLDWSASLVKTKEEAVVGAVRPFAEPSAPLSS